MLTSGLSAINAEKKFHQEVTESLLGAASSCSVSASSSNFANPQTVLKPVSEKVDRGALEKEIGN